MPEPVLYRWLLAAWVGLAVVTFAALAYVSAPYGRHRRAGWGPTVPATAAWLLMESPAVVVMAALFVTGRHRESMAAAVFLLLWEAHYLHRVVVYPLRRRAGSGRTPVAVMAMAFTFNLANGYLNGRWLFELGPERGAGWLADPRFVGGLALFVAGLAVNLHADETLLRLRRRRGGYGVPRGGLFRWVSCPNYLGEIVEWIGWAVLTWSPAGAAFALWTIANLAPRARAHHRWYRERFADYPAERHALLPGLF